MNIINLKALFLESLVNKNTQKLSWFPGAIVTSRCEHFIYLLRPLDHHNVTLLFYQRFPYNFTFFNEPNFELRNP